MNFQFLINRKEKRKKFELTILCPFVAYGSVNDSYRKIYLYKHNKKCLL